MIEERRENGVLHLILGGRGADNRIGLTDLAALAASLRNFDRLPDCRVAVLGGDGPFCGGLDDTAFAPGALREAALAGDLIPYRPRKPVIAAINGACLGEGLVWLAQCADLRIAAPDARFGFTDLARGLGAAATRSRLLRQIPYARAMQLALIGEPISAQEALHFGLITEVADNPTRRAAARAATVLTLSPFTLWGEKETLINGEQLNQHDNFHAAMLIDMVSHFSPDIHEGVEAFVQKRAPRFWNFEQEV